MSRGTTVSGRSALGGVAERAVSIADLLFPLVGLVLALLLPGVGFSGAWHDQDLYVSTLRSVLDNGRAAAIEADIIGPAYIALAAVVHLVGGVSLERSFVVLSEVSLAVAVAASMLLVRVLVTRLAGSPPVVSLVAQSSVLLLFVTSWVWRWSEFPWTHHVALAAGLGFYSLRLVRPPAVWSAAAIGVVLALLALTRSFEFAAVLAAWVIAGVLFAFVPREPIPGVARRLAVGALAFVGTAVAVQYAMGKRDLFLLYGSNLGRQSADVRPEEIATTPTFEPLLLPQKILQLFLDPCYLSICRISDYAASPDGVASLWRLPLAAQLPQIALLPLALLAVGGLFVWAARRPRPAPRSSSVRLLVEMSVAATGLALGYTASVLAGSTHLKYGFVREYLLPWLLVLVVVVCLLFWAIWRVSVWGAARGSARRRGRVSPILPFAAVGLMVAFAFAWISTLPRERGLPRIEASHIGTLEYAARCSGRVCQVEIVARTPSGEPISIPERSTLTFGCGSDRPQLTLYVREPGDGVRVRRCSDPRLVAAWPTVMGLPPDSAHLARVRVSTANG